MQHVVCCRSLSCKKSWSMPTTKLARYPPIFCGGEVHEYILFWYSISFLLRDTCVQAPYIHNFTTFLNSSGRKYVTLIACARCARVSSPQPSVAASHRLRRNIMSICMLHVGKVRAINAKCTCRRNVHDGGGAMSANLRPARRTRGIFPMNIKRHITPTSY